MGLWELAEAWRCPQAQVLLALGQSQPSGSDYEILGPQPSNWASVLAAVSQRKAVREPTHNKSEAAGSYSWMGPQREPVQCFYFSGKVGRERCWISVIYRDSDWDRTGKTPGLPTPHQEILFLIPSRTFLLERYTLQKRIQGRGQLTLENEPMMWKLKQHDWPTGQGLCCLSPHPALAQRFSAFFISWQHPLIAKILWHTKKKNIFCHSDKKIILIHSHWKAITVLAVVIFSFDNLREKRSAPWHPGGTLLP